MKYDQIDSEYYVMSIDRNYGNPLLAFAQTDLSIFLKNIELDEKTLPLPLPFIFADNYTKQTELPDFFMLGGIYAGSRKMRILFRKIDVFGVQFLPVNIINEEKAVTEGFFAINFHNCLWAVDLNNYEGSEPNIFGRIECLKRFSIDKEALNKSPAWRRPIFMLNEKPLTIIVHEKIVDSIREAELTGVSFTPLTEWEHDDISI
jgi:hypothetical protein